MLHAAPPMCAAVFPRVKTDLWRVCETEFLPDCLLPPSSLSSLLRGLDGESFDVAVSQCCDRRPKRNQMLFGLACGGEAYV